MSKPTIPVIYKKKQYLVDRACLSESCTKFRELLQPYKNDFDDYALKLIITDENFSERNIENFLKLCQNLPTDVLDKEMKEICQIAQKFQNDYVYKKSMEFIKTSIDPSFKLPKNSDDQDFMFVEAQTKVNNKNPETNSKPCYTIETNNYEEHSIVYKIFVRVPMFKLNKFYLLDGDKIIESAKQKDDVVMIARGDKVHISKDTKNRIGEIVHNSSTENTIYVSDQKFTLNYTKLEQSHGTAVTLNFLFKGEPMTWLPLDEILFLKHNVNTKLMGEYDHCPFKSKKNMILQTPEHHLTFILRKMDQFTFEAECSPFLDPTIAFSIAISQILGPNFTDERSYF